MSEVAITTYPVALALVIAEREEHNTSVEYERGQINLLADMFPREGVSLVERMTQIERDVQTAKSEATQDEYSGLNGKSIEHHQMGGHPYVLVREPDVGTAGDKEYVGAFALMEGSSFSKNGTLIETTVFVKQGTKASYVEYDPDADLARPVFSEGGECDPVRGSDPDLQAHIACMLRDSYYDLATGQSRN